MSQPIISFKGLSYKIGSRYLLKDIDWEVQKGEHWAVFGMNGSGKTTLLTIAAGYRAYTHGTLTVFGAEYTSENILSHRKKIGLVSSSFFDKYYDRESVMDIVLSGKFGTFGTRYNITDADTKHAKRLMRELHIEHRIDSLFSMLSRGERQNVLIARALFNNPDILILDEPCSGLDVVAREHLLQTVKDLALKTDMTIIYVSHYSEEILDVFDKALLLRNGYVYQQGETNALFNTETISDFLRYPVELARNEQNNRLYIEMESASNIVELLE